MQLPLQWEWVWTDFCTLVEKSPSDVAPDFKVDTPHFPKPPPIIKDTYSRINQVTRKVIVPSKLMSFKSEL